MHMWANCQEADDRDIKSLNAGSNCSPLDFFFILEHRTTRIVECILTQFVGLSYNKRLYQVLYTDLAHDLDSSCCTSLVRFVDLSLLLGIRIRSLVHTSCKI